MDQIQQVIPEFRFRSMRPSSLRIFRARKVFMQTRTYLIVAVFFIGILLTTIYTGLSPNKTGKAVANSSKPIASFKKPSERSSENSQIPDSQTNKTEIPKCRNSTIDYGGYMSFDCYGERDTTVHYEYFKSNLELIEVSTRFDLQAEDLEQTKMTRLGILEGKTRLLGVDKESLVLINLTSDYSETELRIWWTGYLASVENQPSPLTRPTTVPLNSSGISQNEKYIEPDKQ